MWPGKVSNVEQVWDRLCPITHKGSHKFLAGLDCTSVVLWGRRKTFGIKLYVPDYILGIHGQGSTGDATISGIKLIESCARQTHRALASDESNKVQDTGVWRRPVRKQCLPRLRANAFRAYIEIG